MRRLMALAAFALFLALPLWAQHGGGHAGGGHGGGFGGHAGFAGGHGGGFSGGHVSGGVHAGGMRTSPGAARGFSRGPAFAQRGVNHRSFGNRGFRGRRVRTFGFRNNCFGYGCRGSYFYPYAYGGYYDPWWWGDSGSSYDEDYERNRAVASEMNAQSLEEQQMLRREEQEEEAGDQDLNPRSAPSPRESESASAVPATVLVFRDQRKQEVRNYAIVGQTLWNFASPRTEKIPLAYLDLAATTKANDERGLTFHVPASSEAQ
jgi:hypothetical protein